MPLETFNIHPDDVRDFSNLYEGDDEAEGLGFMANRNPLINHPLIIEFCNAQGPMGSMEQTVFRRDLITMIEKLI